MFAHMNLEVTLYMNLQPWTGPGLPMQVVQKNQRSSKNDKQTLQPCATYMAPMLRRPYTTKAIGNTDDTHGFASVYAFQYIPI